jgi:hypothetical protein
MLLQQSKQQPVEELGSKLRLGQHIFFSTTHKPSTYNKKLRD